MAVRVHSPSEIQKMRRTCRLAAEVLDYIEPFVQPGVSTDELDRLCHDFILRNGAIPAPLNYKGFPKSICTSVNEVVCHGIPGKYLLKSGDIVNIDVTTILEGYFGDTSEMFLVGDVSEEARKLVEVTRESMWLGIREVAAGKRIGDIGAAIFEFAHGKHGYGVVDKYCGHGIGVEFHTDPKILHVGKRGVGTRMVTNTTFTIEPMLNLGSPDCEPQSDGWTVLTADRSLSAQTEHTVLVTATGFEVLTLRPSSLE